MTEEQLRNKICDELGAAYVRKHPACGVHFLELRSKKAIHSIEEIKKGGLRNEFRYFSCI